MTTLNPLPQPTVPVRGKVYQTLVDANILSGFMDENHLRNFLSDYLTNLDEGKRDGVIDKWTKSREFVSSLSEMDLSDVVIRPLEHSYIETIKADRIFINTFASKPYKFAWIRPEKVIALQSHVKTRMDSIPSDEQEMIEFFLPLKWDVPAEITFTPPTGPIYIISSSPAMMGFEANLEPNEGRLIIQPPKHINLLQVMKFQNRYYLKNGYHRLSDAVRNEIHEVPALITEAIQPQEVAMNGEGFFNLGYTINLKRPPLIADFHSEASINVKLRERRYGISLNLQIAPFVIGI